MSKVYPIEFETYEPARNVNMVIFMAIFFGALFIMAIILTSLHATKKLFKNKSNLYVPQFNRSELYGRIHRKRKKFTQSSIGG